MKLNNDIIEVKYKNTVKSIKYSKNNISFSNIIADIINAFQMNISNDEIVSLFYIEKENEKEGDRICINSIDDIEQITLIHYKNYKGNLQFEVNLSLRYSSKNSSQFIEEEMQNDNMNVIYLSENKLDLDEIIETKATKIINSKLNEIQMNNTIISKTMTLNNVSKNFIDESFECPIEMLNVKDHNTSNLNQPLSVCRCKTTPTYLSQLKESNNNKSVNKYKNDITLKQEKDKKPIEVLCSNCFQSIQKQKYICILCSDYYLCDNCYVTHSSFHPMLLVSQSQNNISSIEELANHFNQKQKNKGLLSTLYSLIHSPTVYNLKIYPFSKQANSLVLAQKEKKDLHIVIENLTKFPIEGDLIFQIRNFKNLIIKIPPIQGMKKEDVQMAKMEIEAGLHKEEYKVSIKLQSRNVVVNCNKLTLLIKVVNKEDIIDETINLYFKDNESIRKKSDNDKLKLYNIIMKGLINKDVNEITTLLSKNNYDINKALDEMSLQIEDNAEEDSNN